MTRPVRLLLPLLAALLLLAPAAGAKAPGGAAFYTPPSPLPGNAHGDMIWWRPLEAANNMRLPSSAANRLVLYRSVGVDGKPVAESASLAIPRGRPPAGGWPVLAWAHGTTGVADQCAPTRLSRRNDEYSTDLRAQLAAYVRAGYAVVAPDYEGLGTPGVHPYLIGASEGRSVLDGVRAARRVDPHIGRMVAIMGHSQGGHAALWATAMAHSYTPELKVRATVAYAPASHIKELASVLDALRSPSPLSALVATIIRGADVAYPSLGIPSLLGDSAAALYPSVDEQCLNGLYATDSWGGIAPSDILKPGVDRTPLLEAVDKSDPGHLKIKTPVEILQGSADTTVPPLITDQLVNELRGKPAPTYKKYPAITHSGIVEAGRKDARAFVKRHIGR